MQYNSHNDKIKKETKKKRKFAVVGEKQNSLTPKTISTRESLFNKKEGLKSQLSSVGTRT